MEEQHELSRMCDDGCPNPPTVELAWPLGGEVKADRNYWVGEIAHIFRVDPKLLSDSEISRCR